ncbi:MAG: ATP-binding protein [Candidatus Hydrogenedentes bacterium]|nr:ATP-binding protein [Candidatus Hydrogenedentota bacterium]
METQAEIADAIRQSTGPDLPVQTQLSTNQKVIARVTDGIYRQPGSALRELISNAYDADATRVTIKTDRPRFSSILIEDDGLGMSPDVLAYLIKNIGGSAKRTGTGESLGITQDDDVSLSPSGRKLIGKLGIGIFSVSQLTRSFQIITKVTGDAFRTVAIVKLNQFSEMPTEGPEDGEFQAGEVLLWREYTPDINDHGTTIVLTQIRPQTRGTLQSTNIWEAVDNPIETEEGSLATAFVPQYHIGRLDDNSDFLTKGVKELQALPWKDDDSPSEAFSKLVGSVWASLVTDNPNPKLDVMFDNYLQMIWELSLALPIPYVEGHLFDEPVADDWADFFALSNEPKGGARPLHTSSGDKVRDLLELRNGLDVTLLPFTVYIDDLELRRPIRFRNLPVSSHALKKPLVFLGKIEEHFVGLPITFSAGPLAFEAYFYWTPKIAPVDHRGALIRIHGASGSLFDHTFFRYQVSEQTRLRQITCEIFVSQGLEPALNIDREAFNTAHPHMVYIIKWVHSALRQLATAQKRAAQVIREESRQQARQQVSDALQLIVETANREHTSGEGAVPDVVFTDTSRESSSAKQIPLSFTIESNAQHSYERRAIFASESSSKQAADKHEKSMRAIIQVLSIYGVLEQLAPMEQENMLRAIADILRTEYV